MNTDLHFSSDKDDWGTPSYLFDYLNDIYHFTLDPCASDDNHLCDKYYTKHDDGLSKSWEGERVFMNPPYGKEIGKWIKKAAESTKLGATTIALLPSRTCTDWFHKYIAGNTIIFINKRIKFSGADSGAPFPSMIVKFNAYETHEGSDRDGLYKTLNIKDLTSRGKQ